MVGCPEQSLGGCKNQTHNLSVTSQLCLPLEHHYSTTQVVKSCQNSDQPSSLTRSNTQQLPRLTRHPLDPDEGLELDEELLRVEKGFFSGSFAGL